MAMKVTCGTQGLRWLAIGAVALLLVGCKDASKSTEASAAEQAAALPPLLLSPEDIHTLQSKTLTAGPAITGSVLAGGARRPARRGFRRGAGRAQGERRPGQEGRPAGAPGRHLDSRHAALRARRQRATAEQAYEQAQRQYERLAKLREGRPGLDAAARRRRGSPQRHAERSRVRRAATLVAARQQLQRTMVRAPFDGIVSDRKVSAGDTAQVGKELLKVIDPCQPALRGLRLGRQHWRRAARPERHASASMAIEDKDFTGTITRVNPGRQCHDAPGRGAGAVSTRASSSPASPVCMPRGASRRAAPRGCPCRRIIIVRDGDNAFAWRVQDGKLHKVKLDAGRPRCAQRRIRRQGRSRGGRRACCVIRAPRCTTAAAGAADREVGPKHVPLQLQHQAAGHDGGHRHRADVPRLAGHQEPARQPAAGRAAAGAGGADPLSGRLARDRSSARSSTASRSRCRAFRRSYEIRSTASEGSAQIVIIFNFKKDMVEAADEIRNAIGSVRYKLPLEMREPVLFRVDPSARAGDAAGAVVGDAVAGRDLAPGRRPARRPVPRASTACRRWTSTARCAASCRCCCTRRSCASTTSRWPRWWARCGGRTPPRRWAGSRATSTSRASAWSDASSRPREFEDIVLRRNGDEIVRLGQVATVQDGFAERRRLQPAQWPPERGHFDHPLARREHGVGGRRSAHGGRGDQARRCPRARSSIVTQDGGEEASLYLDERDRGADLRRRASRSSWCTPSSIPGARR